VIFHFLLLIAWPLNAQQDIAGARAMGAGSKVTVSGIITSGDELGIIRFMQDHTAGMALYSPDLSGLVRGDSVTVVGTLKDFNSLLEMDPIENVTLHSSGNTLPAPVKLTPGAFEEKYEGLLVQVEEATLAASGVFQRDAYIFSAGGETGQLYINDPYSPLIGTPIPNGPVNLTGPLGAYQGTYQLLPRDQDDLVVFSSIQFTSVPLVSQLSTTGFTLGWTTDVEGSTEAWVGLSPDLELAPIKVDGVRSQHQIEITGRSPAELLYIQPFSVHEGDTARAAMQVVIMVSESAGTFRALFNRGVDPSVSLGLMEAEYLPDGLDEELISYLDGASESIEIAMYNLNNSGISDISAALNRAHGRGVVVRAVYDGDVNALGMQSLNPSIGKLASPPSDYPLYGIMHNKFVVIDALSADPMKPIVWTGSTNLTQNQINIDPNNVVVIQDQSLAKAYQLEFNEMFGSSGPQPDPAKARFGPDKKDNTPHEFLIGGKRVECYFSPSDGTHHQILQAIESADYSIRVATMLITKQDIGNALAGFKGSGGEVQVLIHDYDQYGEAVLDVLKASLGSEVRLNGEPGIMHHKYMMVDGASADSDPLLLTGSHNWSASAQLRNDENTLIIHDQGVANAFYQEFVRRFEAGEIVTSVGKEKADPGDQRIRIYPNPASEWICLEPDAGLLIKDVAIFDLAGREIIRYHLPVPNPVPVEQLTGGIYLLKIRLNNGPSSHRLILVQ
jgi:phosphatidylserine/phosphatidylglycerophosphate/cardiolipin synthase-like enzyme